MHLRSASEARGLRMGAGALARHHDFPGTIQLNFRDGTASVFRMCDEPAAWRWHSSGELVPSEQLQTLLRSDDLRAELAERQMLEDRERAKVILAKVSGNGAAKVVEQRGSYALIESGEGLYQVTCSGIELMPCPAAGSIARAVLDAVAPDVPTVEATVADEMKGV